MFKVGDLLLGTSNMYTITSVGCVVKVVEVYDEENISVEVIKSGERVHLAGGISENDYVGCVYDVSPSHFTYKILNKGR